MCSVTGNRLIWEITGIPSQELIFSESDSVGESVFSTPTSTANIVSFLLRNNAGRLESILFLTFSFAVFNETGKYNITCSSHNDSDVIEVSAAGKLLVPLMW